MHVIKKIVLFLATAGLVLWLWLLPTLLAWRFSVARPEITKKWLANSGFYDKALDTALTQFGKNPDPNFIFKDPGLTDRLKASLTPQFLRTQFEQQIDGAYWWLNNREDALILAFDFTPVAEKVVEAVGSYAKERALSLPACGRNDRIEEDTDFLSISCLPPGTNIDEQVSKFTSDLTSSDGPLANPRIDFREQSGARQTTNPGDSLLPLRKIHRLLMAASIIVPLLIVVSLVLIFWLKDDKRKAASWVSRSLLPIGIITLLGSIVTRVAASRFGSQNPNTDGALGSLAVPLAKQAAGDISLIQIWVGASYIVLAISGFIFLKQTKVSETQETASKKELVKPNIQKL